MNYSTDGVSKERGNILSVLCLFKPEDDCHIQSRKSGSDFLLVSPFVGSVGSVNNTLVEFGSNGVKTKKDNGRIV